MIFRMFSVTCSMMILLLPLLATLGAAQSRTNPATTPDEEQNETFRDTLKKMQYKREEDEHRKLVKTAAEVKDNAELLLKEASGDKLPKSSEKKLREIEKGAKKIRTESGASGNDEQLEPVPTTLEAALKQLNEASKKLHTEMEKTSRHVMSATVVSEATEVIQLVKLLRGYLN